MEKEDWRKMRSRIVERLNRKLERIINDKGVVEFLRMKSKGDPDSLANDEEFVKKIVKGVRKR